jgi:uncharacterized DUF497 family protein
MLHIFEWDEDKADSNFRKHKVSFVEAQTVFLDSLSITVPDLEHSQIEPRLKILGMSSQRKVLVISFTERGEVIRLISARKADRSELEKYEEEVID